MSAAAKSFQQKCESFFNECNGGSPLTIQQLAATLRKATNTDMSDAQIAEIFLEVDADADKLISWEEFSDALFKKNPKEVTKCELKAVFDSKDTDKSGKLDKAEVKAMCQQLEMDVSESHLDKMLGDADTDGDGQVNFNEFLAAWN